MSILSILPPGIERIVEITTCPVVNTGKLFLDLMHIVFDGLNYAANFLRSRYDFLSRIALGFLTSSGVLTSNFMIRADKLSIRII